MCLKAIAVIFSLLLLIGWGGSLSLPALALDIDNGARVFEVHCVGCHVKGGNIIRRGKTLKQKALQKNKVDTLAAIAQLVTYGQGIMSAYQNRLTADEIQNVSAYVLEQAQKEWR
jgi:cytochrome c6